MKAYLTILAALAFGVAPFVTEGFAGFRADQFPIPQDNAPVQPAGYAFGIWSVIYLWLLIYAVLGVWKYHRAPGWDATYLPMAISMGIGAVWIKVATISVIWATVLIWIMLLSALWALFASRKGNPDWALGLPIGLYAGWLTAASCVALGLVGAGYGIGMAQIGWAFAALGLAVILALICQYQRPGIWTYGVAVGWGFAGIAVQNFGQNTWIAITAATATALILLLSAIQLRPND